MIDLKTKLIEGLDLIKINPSNEQIDLLLKFMDLVLEKNKVLNLTAIRAPEDFIIKHLIDSLTAEKYIPNGSKVIDIGTGAGIPGIPLKIIRPDIEMTLLDSTGKKVAFIKEAIEALDLKDTYPVVGRAEDLGQSDSRGTFDIAILRAVGSLSVLAEYSIPLIKKNGFFIAMKGSEKESETQSMNALDVLGGKISKVEEFTLPFSDIERSIIIVEKEKETPNKYPRNSGIPTKSPL